MQSEKSWVVFAQKPFEKPQYVIDYLGNYTHRVAISNHRLIKLENDYVYFYYKDYADNAKRKIMKLGAVEFIRRFLQHVLPYRFCKIRYFGFLSNRFKNENIKIARECIEIQTNAKVTIKQSISELLAQIEREIMFNLKQCVCKSCGGLMILLVEAENDVSQALVNSS